MVDIATIAGQPTYLDVASPTPCLKHRSISAPTDTLAPFPPALQLPSGND